MPYGSNLKTLLYGLTAFFMKNRKKLEDLFPSLEREKMNKIYGGLQAGGSSQLKTVTVSPVGGGDDGADDLLPGETQDSAGIAYDVGVGVYKNEFSTGEVGVREASVSASVYVAI
jgi:hypothetical protein